MQCAEYEAGGEWHPLSSPSELGEGTAPVPVRASLAGLQAEGVLYHYRLCAANENASLYPEDPRSSPCGQDATLTTPGKPLVKEEWASGVTDATATLNATINPQSSETEYRFEAGQTTAYGEETPIPMGKVAEGIDSEDHVLSATIDVEAGTLYHWRVVAVNGIGEAEGEDRELRSFRPFAAKPCANDSLRPGAAAKLPDCRAYEQVSPAAKDGGEAGTTTETGGLANAPRQASPSGEAIAYGSWTAFGSDPQSAPATSQYLSGRAPGGLVEPRTSTPATKAAPKTAPPSPASPPTSPGRR